MEEYVVDNLHIPRVGATRRQTLKCSIFQNPIFPAGLPENSVVSRTVIDQKKLTIGWSQALSN